MVPGVEPVTEGRRVGSVINDGPSNTSPPLPALASSASSSAVSASSTSGSVLQSQPQPLPPLSLIAHSAWKLFVRNGLLCFNLRAGLALFLQLLTIVRKGGT